MRPVHLRETANTSLSAWPGCDHRAPYAPLFSDGVQEPRLLLSSPQAVQKFWDQLMLESQEQCPEIELLCLRPSGLFSRVPLKEAECFAARGKLPRIVRMPQQAILRDCGAVSAPTSSWKVWSTEAANMRLVHAPRCTGPFLRAHTSTVKQHAFMASGANRSFFIEFLAFNLVRTGP
jgi:hypothetical protein